MVFAYRRLNSDLLLQCNLTIHTCGSSVIVLLFITDTYTEFFFLLIPLIKQYVTLRKAAAVHAPADLLKQR